MRSNRKLLNHESRKLTSDPYFIMLGSETYGGTGELTTNN